MVQRRPGLRLDVGSAPCAPDHRRWSWSRARTLKGPLPIETALNYAKQIADALRAAHDKGITHRDLKPSNIMITPAGVVKVLDFGLAAQRHEHQEGETLTMPPTRPGTIMGTAAYMSPEQARGEPVDKRADIWAFGVVLYEMLAGTPAFARETASDTHGRRVERRTGVE